MRLERQADRLSGQKGPARKAAGEASPPRAGPADGGWQGKGRGLADGGWQAQGAGGGEGTGWLLTGLRDAICGPS